MFSEPRCKALSVKTKHTKNHCLLVTSVPKTRSAGDYTALLRRDGCISTGSRCIQRLQQQHFNRSRPLIFPMTTRWGISMGIRVGICVEPAGVGKCNVEVLNFWSGDSLQFNGNATLQLRCERPPPQIQGTVSLHLPRRGCTTENADHLWLQFNVPVMQAPCVKWHRARSGCKVESL